MAFLPSRGWLVIAFPTDNPGAWLMHCHIVGSFSHPFAFPRYDTLCLLMRALGRKLANEVKKQTGMAHQRRPRRAISREQGQVPTLPCRLQRGMCGLEELLRQQSCIPQGGFGFVGWISQSGWSIPSSGGKVEQEMSRTALLHF